MIPKTTTNSIEKQNWRIHSREVCCLYLIFARLSAEEQGRLVEREQTADLLREAGKNEVASFSYVQTVSRTPRNCPSSYLSQVSRISLPFPRALSTASFTLSSTPLSLSRVEVSPNTLQKAELRTSMRLSGREMRANSSNWDARGDILASYRTSLAVHTIQADIRT